MKIFRVNNLKVAFEFTIHMFYDSFDLWFWRAHLILMKQNSVDHIDLNFSSFHLDVTKEKSLQLKKSTLLHFLAKSLHKLRRHLGGQSMVNRTKLILCQTHSLFSQFVYVNTFFYLKPIDINNINGALMLSSVYPWDPIGCFQISVSNWTNKSN